MRRAVEHLSRLSNARKLVLGGAVAALLSVFMPWHTVGFLDPHVFNGFGDQNLIVGLLTFICSLLALLIVVLPLAGFRLPRVKWRESSQLSFLGGEAALLVVVLMLMHTTSLVRAVNYQLDLGLYLALLGTLAIFLGGYFLGAEERAASIGYQDSLVREPRQRGQDFHEGIAEQSTTREFPRTERSGKAESDDDRRMRLDI
jgi:hypothetical protein